MYFHPWLPTVTPSQPISLPRPAPTCARTFGASENTASTWKNCRPRSVRSLCPSIFPCDNILHVSSGYPKLAEPFLMSDNRSNPVFSRLGKEGIEVFGGGKVLKL